jgi:hypothetical protein
LQKFLKKNNPVGEGSTYSRQEESNKSKNIFSEVELYKREIETYTGAPEDFVSSIYMAKLAWGKEKNFFFFYNI